MIWFDLNLSLSIIEPLGEGHLNGLLKAKLQYWQFDNRTLDHLAWNGHNLHKTDIAYFWQILFSFFWVWPVFGPLVFIIPLTKIWNLDNSANQHLQLSLISNTLKAILTLNVRGPCQRFFAGFVLKLDSVQVLPSVHLHLQNISPQKWTIPPKTQKLNSHPQFFLAKLKKLIVPVFHQWP